ncbi:sorbosone dehydrogenase, partial [Streptococcus agalactiae]
MTSKLAARLALLCAAVSCSVAAQAQDNMQNLEGFKSTGASLNIETVPQGGARAAALKANLKQVKLPPGFKIDL